MKRQSDLFGIPYPQIGGRMPKVGGGLTKPIYSPAVLACREKDEERVKRIRHEWKRISAWMAPMVFDRDNFRCVYCGRTEGERLEHTLTIDHVIPISFGGSNDMTNLATACWLCNHKKGNTESCPK